ncbi:MAG: NAD-dependent epimerase/dehydratase family protein [Treponema sp.]|jgi:nucleoside-diphosphate-sugar epimerase|nr:NAD-dependent epimerase/dehydratase family protein [Treponema sp.]
MNRIIREDIHSIIDSYGLDDKWEAFRDKTVLVTGGTSAFLAYFVYVLLELNRRRNLNCAVICMARNLEKAKAMYAAYLDDSRLKLYIHDIVEPLAPLRPHELKDVDYIVHGAGVAGPRFYTSIPAKVLDTAYFGTRNVFEYARDAGGSPKAEAPVVLLTSSAAVYGDPLKEDGIGESDYGYMDPLTARSIYGESKRICETMGLAYAIEYGLPVKIARFPNSFGPGMRLDKGSAIADFLSAALKGEDIVIQSDGTAKREFLYFTDLVAGLFYVLLFGDILEPYNIGSGLVYTMKEFARTVQEVFKEKNIAVKIQDAERLEDQGSPKIKRLSATRLSALGWSPHISLHEGVARCKASAEE